MSAIQNTEEIITKTIEAVLKSLGSKTYELWEIAGEAYWIEDGTNNVYDFDTEECIGTYNRKTKEFTIK